MQIDEKNTEEWIKFWSEWLRRKLIKQREAEFIAVHGQKRGKRKVEKNN